MDDIDDIVPTFSQNLSTLDSPRTFLITHFDTLHVQMKKIWSKDTQNFLGIWTWKVYRLHQLSFPFNNRSPPLGDEEHSQDVHHCGLPGEVVEDSGKPNVRNLGLWTSTRYEGAFPCSPNRFYENQKTKCI